MSEFLQSGPLVLIQRHDRTVLLTVESHPLALQRPGHLALPRPTAAVRLRPHCTALWTDERLIPGALRITMAAADRRHDTTQEQDGVRVGWCDLYRRAAFLQGPWALRSCPEGEAIAARAIR